MNQSAHDARVRAAGQRSAPPAAAPRRQAPDQGALRVRRWPMQLMMITTPLVLLLALAVAVGYVRLLHGPISLKFLVAPIERGLSADLGGAVVRIEDAIVRLTDSGRLQFRLSSVRLADAGGQPVASAPLAAIELASSALWQGRIAPVRIELIDPRLLLVYSEEQGLSVSFARPAAAEAEPAGGAPLAAEADRETGLPAGLQRVDLARALAQASERARRGLDASSHLREVGLRNATLIIEQPAGVTAWRVPEASLDLEHKQKRSIISGKATIVSGRMPWSLTFRSEESEKSNTIEVKAAISDLVPRTLAKALPQLGLLDGFDLPVAGTATFELSRAGDLLAGAVALEAARGRVQPPWLPDVTFPIDAGRIDLRYQRDRGRIELAPSTLQWGQSNITLTGHLATRRAVGGEGWAFDLAATAGSLSAEEFGVRQIPIEKWVATGTVVPERRHLELNRFQMVAGGAEISLAGLIDAPGDVADASFEGRIGAMPLATLKALWPRALAPGARGWVGERVTRGRLQSGTFRWLAGRYLDRAGASADTPEQRLSLAIEASDVMVRPIRTMSPIEAPRALVRIEGGSIEIGMPEAAIAPPSGRRVPLRGGRLTAIDIFGERPHGEIAFRVASPLPQVLEVVNQEPLGLLKQAGIAADGIDGRVEGQLKLSLPLITSLEGRDIKVDGKLRLTEGRARQLIGPYDVQGATLTVDFVERQAEAAGEMLVAGVPTRLAWQRAFDAGADKPSPLKLTARLDNSDRTQLGLDVNHIVQGEVPIEVTVTPTPRPEPHIALRADLTAAELVLDAIAWRKPPTHAASLEFEIVRSKGRTELADFRIRGDNIAADGHLVIGADNRLREFSFPSFTVNVVSRFEMQGQLRADNVLEVKAKARHFDGRDFFRGLFSIGEVTERPLGPSRTRSGIDVIADIDTLAGFSDVAMRNLKVRLSRRADKLVALNARGTLDGGEPLEVTLAPGEPRKLRARTDDAGQAMRLVGFYPNMQGGRMLLEVNLDGKGAAEKSGTLWVERFRVLGDPVVNEVVGGSGRKQLVRQAYDFQSMKAPFSVGNGQFVLDDSYMRGDLQGVSLNGKVDFKAGRVNLGGTYIPLQGLNNVLGGIPLLGPILSGPRGEGIFGITFGVKGSMQQPQVLVNPLSIVAPGILRGLTEMAPPNQSVTPRQDPPVRGEPKVRSVAPQGEPAGAGKTKRPVQPEVIGGWTSESTAPLKK